MSYHAFLDEEGDEYGSFEVFHHEAHSETDGMLTEPGWYWWACMPGCLPDGEPTGPFATEQEAINDARNT